MTATRTARLRARLEEPRILIVPAVYDAHSARLVERSGFDAAFMSGFGVSASRHGLPDTGLVSFGEMAAAARDIAGAVTIPVFGDADTGYGNSLNVKRTVHEYARAGIAAVMIEDQVAPKRCGHTRGKAVVAREEAFDRIRAAVDARAEGADVLILARTDARHTHGLPEALERAARFHEIGADILFVEAPETREELAIVGRDCPGFVMANMIEGGLTPVLPPGELEALGFDMVAHAVTLLAAATAAVEAALASLKDGRPPDGLASFERLKSAVGFDAYYAAERAYARDL